MMRKFFKDDRHFGKKHARLAVKVLDGRRLELLVLDKHDFLRDGEFTSFDLVLVDGEVMPVSTLLDAMCEFDFWTLEECEDILSAVKTVREREAKEVW